MNGAQILDIVQTEFDHTDPTDQDYAERRALYLGDLQQIYPYVNSRQEFEWRYKEGSTLTVSAGQNSVAQPADFYGWGNHGLLTDSIGNQWFRKPRWLVEQMRRRYSGSGYVTFIFSEWQSKIQLPFTASSAISFIPYYLADETPTDDATPLNMPDRYLRLVVIPAMHYKRQNKVNDARVELWTGELRDGLIEMAANENPIKMTPIKLPRIHSGDR